MKILHPDKSEYLPLDKLEEYYKDDYYRIIADDEVEALDYFLSCFEDFRISKNARITDRDLYNDLPFSINNNAWRERQNDTKIIDHLIQHRAALNILDVGCWNGWLCNFLAKKKHNLTGLGLFTDPFDGLKASKFYSSKFCSIQLPIEELYRIEDRFDLIIFNRNWAYINDKQKIFNEAKERLNKDGIILFTGLSFYFKETEIKKIIRKANDEFCEKYGISLFYKPVKGYLDKSDFNFFLENKIDLKSKSLIKNFAKKIATKKPVNYYGFYKK